MTFIETLKEVITNAFSDFIEAVLILLIGLTIARAFGKMLKVFLEELELNKVFEKTTAIGWDVEEILSSLASVVGYVIVVFLALRQLNMTSYLLYVMAGFAGIVLLTSIIFKIVDFFPDFLSGFQLRSRRNLRLNDKVRFFRNEYKLLKIGWMTSMMTDREKDIIAMPNSVAQKYLVKITPNISKSKQKNNVKKKK